VKYWIILFTQETYEIVKSKSLIGVRSNVWKAFSENMKVGDHFISYVSKKMTFDGFGAITGEAVFEDTKIFHEEKWFPCRRRVRFEKVGLAKPSGDLFHGIPPFNAVNTGPGNYLMCKGGFVEVTKKDYHWLLSQIQK